MEFLKEFKEKLGGDFEALQNAVKKELEKTEAKTLSELEAQKKANEKLIKSLGEVKEILGVSEDDEITEALKKGKNDDELKFNVLKKELADLKTSLENEKTAKNEAIKKAKLKELIDGIENLNKDHREIVEIKLGKNLKIDEKTGEAYFESPGDKSEYIKDFFKNNEKYLAASGNAGSGNTNGFNFYKTDKKFSEMSLAERAILYKENENLYNELKKAENYAKI